MGILCVWILFQNASVYSRFRLKLKVIFSSSPLSIPFPATSLKQHCRRSRRVPVSGSATTSWRSATPLGQRLTTNGPIACAGAQYMMTSTTLTVQPFETTAASASYRNGTFRCSKPAPPATAATESPGSTPRQFRPMCRPSAGRSRPPSERHLLTATDSVRASSRCLGDLTPGGRTGGGGEGRGCVERLFLLGLS